MPTPSTFQTVGMPTYEGLAPGLDANGFINPIAFKMNVVAKTASYTVLATESGTVFTTSGSAGAVVFTLPTAAAGLCYWFINAADQDMTITSTPADKFVLFNDVAADSIAFSTASEKVGGGVFVVSDGTNWFGFVHLGTETQTPTIAT